MDAKKARDADESWKEIQKRWGIEEETKKKERALKAPVWNPGPLTYRGSNQPKIPSLQHNWDNCTKAPTPEYTGTNIIGIVVQHKSCLQPVFSKEEAKDSANMRR